MKRWLEIRVPLVYNQAKEHPDWRGHNFHFLFWTTGRLSDYAVAMIKRAQRTIRPTRYTLEYCDADGVLAEARKTNDKPIIAAVRQHFLNHPLAETEQSQRRVQRGPPHKRVANDDDDDL